MKEFTTKNIKAANKVADGEEYIFTFTDCGSRFEITYINYEGGQYMKTESHYSDAATGKALDTYYCQEDDREIFLIKNLDGTFEYDICY